MSAGLEHGLSTSEQAARASLFPLHAATFLPSYPSGSQNRAIFFLKKQYTRKSLAHKSFHLTYINFTRSCLVSSTIRLTQFAPVSRTPNGSSSDSPWSTHTLGSTLSPWKRLPSR